MGHDHRDSRSQASHTDQRSSRSVKNIDFEAEHDPDAARRWSNMKLMRARQELASECAGGGSTKVPPGATRKVDRAANESAASLPDNLRTRFESSLGTELSGVRVHTGSASASAAESIGAKAYTTGQDIHFGPGQYDPSSEDGQRLLAHEVAHTVQQGNSRTQPQPKLEVSGPADAHEHEADRAADAMISGMPASVSPSGAASSDAVSSVQRKNKNGSGEGNTRASTPAEKRVEQMIGILRRQVDKVSADLDAGAGKIDPTLIAHMRRVLSDERGELLTALTNLPSGSALQMEGFAMSSRVTQVITRLDAIAGAHDGRAAVGITELQGDDRALVFQAAEEEAPAGYCDTASQGVEPCDLDPSTRDRYRRRVAAAVDKARENWKLAIAAAQIEEKLNKGKLTFEQQLGELLLGALFGVLGAGVKALAAHGLKKVDKALTRNEWDDAIGVMQPKGVDPDVLKAGQGIVDKTVEKGTPMAQSKLKEGITAQQLAEQARQPTPSDREGFLATLKTAPDQWHDAIIMNLDRLFDADLASLVAAMPLESPKLSLPTFEARIKHLVTSFEQQVQPIGQLSLSHPHPVKVVSAHGVRLALAANERKPNKELHGEWRTVPVNTGKMTFVRWIDDEMKAMAMARARQGDAYADTQMRAADDASYWDAQSLQVLAAETSSPSTKSATE